MPAVKLNLKDKLRENELDLSMCDLQEVPVKEISLIKKATSLDLSNNQLSVLGNIFAPSLIYLVKLDLSQNRLKELPDNFGELKNLKSLDLYNNKLIHLPLSLGECKALRWLDLKNNPLSAAFAEVAGPCIDTKQCQACAKRIIPFLNSLREQLTKEHQRRQAQKKRAKEEASQQLLIKGNQKKMPKKIKKTPPVNEQQVNDVPVVPSEEPVQETEEQSVQKETTDSKLRICLRIFAWLFAYFSILALYILTICYLFNERWYNIATRWISVYWNKFLDMLPSILAQFLTSVIDLIVIILKFCSGILHILYEPFSNNAAFQYVAAIFRECGIYVHGIYMDWVFVMVQKFKEAFVDF